MNQLKEFFQWILDAVKVWIIIQPWEAALIVRSGKKIRKVNGGIYFRIPYLDSVYVQETRLRISEMSMQTLTTKDGQTITMNCPIGYQITDLEKLYNTLYKPETTIEGIIKSEIASYVFEKKSNDVKPKDIEKRVIEHLKTLNYGLDFTFTTISNFAIVRTFRLIQDQSWSYEGLSMTQKK